MCVDTLTNGSILIRATSFHVESTATGVQKNSTVRCWVARKMFLRGLEHESKTVFPGGGEKVGGVWTSS